MKKLLLVLLIVFSLTACNNTNTNTEVEEPKESTEEQETLKLDDTYKFYSDDKQMVFKTDNGYLVFTYEGSKVTGEKAYLDYQTNEVAKYAATQIEKNETIDKIEVDNNYVIITYNKSQWEGLTTDLLILNEEFGKNKR